MESYTEMEMSASSLKLFPLLDEPTAWLHCLALLVVVM